jgi:beta-RFAP synthase
MRSAVGTYGFRDGGLIVDSGKELGRPLGRLAHRRAVPAAWRIVLVRSDNVQGLAGDYEADAFSRLPAVPDDVTRELWRITEAEMLPALDRSDCGAFGEAVYRFGRLAGECFAAVQGGPFASPKVARLVDSIRGYGVPGVGQSSWGPTIFAFTASEAEAQALSQWLQNSRDRRARQVTIARPNNRGAQVSML